MSTPRSSRRPTPDEVARRYRTQTLARLAAVQKPTAGQQALRRRLMAMEAADPAADRNDDLKRTLGLS